MSDYRRTKTLMIKPEDILEVLRARGDIPADATFQHAWMACPATGLVLCIAASSPSWPEVDEHDWPPRVVIMHLSG